MSNISNSNINPPASIPVPTPVASIWVTVNTSTSPNVKSMEISKSLDYDIIVNNAQFIK